MEGQTILITAMTILPTTIASLAAWRAAAQAKHNTNGALSGPLVRIEAVLENLLEWQVEHDREHEVR